MNLIYQAPYDEEHRDYFKLLPFEKGIVFKLEQIIKDGSGIYVLCGNRGVGKTSLKNIAVEKVCDDTDVLVINISFYNNNKDLYREILMRIPIVIEKRIEEIYSQIDSILKQIIVSFKIVYKHFDSKDEVDIMRKVIFNENNYLKERVSVLKELIRKLSREEELKGYPLNKWYNIVAKIEREIKFIRMRHNNTFRSVNKIIDKIDRCFYYTYKKKLKKYLTLSSEFESIEKSLKKVEKLHRKIVNLNKIKTLSNNQLYYFDLEIQDTVSYIDQTSYNSYSNLSLSFASDLNYIGLKSKIGRKNYYTKKSSEAHTIIKNITYDLKEKQLIDLLKTISNWFKLSLIIDELDKKTNSEVLDMINYNKRLFLDSKITVILITNIYLSLFLIENSSYIHRNNIITVRSLDFIEFILRAEQKQLNICDNFFDNLELYFLSRFNNSELNTIVVNNYSFCSPKGFIMYSFMNSDFYYSLDGLSKEVFSIFYLELIQLVFEVKKIKLSEYDRFVTNFLNRNAIYSDKIIVGFKRLKETLINNSFKYSFCLPFLTKHSEQILSNRLEKEISENRIFYQKLNGFLNKQINDIYFVTQNNSFYCLDVTGLEEKGVSLKQLKFKYHRFKLDNDKHNINIVGFNLKEYKSELIQKMGYTENYSKYTTKYVDSRSENYDDVIQILKTEKVIGVVFFYPYFNYCATESEKQSEKLLVITINDFKEIKIFSFIEYDYLSNKSIDECEMLKIKKYIHKMSIKYLEIDQKESLYTFKNCYRINKSYQKEAILDICISKMPEWLKKFE